MSKKHWLFAMASTAVVLILCGMQMAPNLFMVHAANISNTGSLSGAVEAPKPFKAAQVYIRNVDKNILYMVYASGGRYHAVNLFPGNYEVSVSKRGFSSDATNQDDLKRIYSKIEMLEKSRFTVEHYVRNAPAFSLVAWIAVLAFTANGIARAVPNWIEIA